MVRLSLITACAVAFLFAPIGTALSDTISIGEDGINSIGLGTGAGVIIGQVEDTRPGDLEAGDSPANRNTTTDPADVFELNGVAPTPNEEISNHAQQVAGVMISSDDTDGTGMLDNDIAPTGVAPGASLHSSTYLLGGAVGHEEAVLTLQYIADIPGMLAVNHSWGKPPEDDESLDGSSVVSLAIDWSTNRHQVLHIIAGNQGTGGLPVPTDSYNGMTIARSAKDANGVYRLVSPDNFDGEDAERDRTSVALIAPGDDIELTGLGNAHAIGNGSSFAAPHVTGTVALLQQGVFGTNPRRPQVMKAVLMNSADKIEGIMGMERTVENDGDDWFDTDAHADPNIPLDIAMGTGHLNASRAKTQFDAGEFGPGGVPPIGWDWGTQNDPFIPNKYTLTLNANDWVSATLVWDREVFLNSPNPDYEPGDEFIDFGFANFDLFLVRLSRF
jgi:hypothetical protein